MHYVVCRRLPLVWFCDPQTLTPWKAPAKPSARLPLAMTIFFNCPLTDHMTSHSVAAALALSLAAAKIPTTAVVGFVVSLSKKPHLSIFGREIHFSIYSWYVFDLHSSNVLVCLWCLVRTVMKFRLFSSAHIDKFCSANLRLSMSLYKVLGSFSDIPAVICIDDTSLDSTVSLSVFST